MRTLYFMLAGLACGTLADVLHGADPTAIKVADIKTATIPDRKIPEPEPRGKPYPLPATKWETKPILWGWTCELPDGSGLAFGGIHQTADDGNPHSRIMENGRWKPIVDELRKNNPLQRYTDAVRSLRGECKDTLARARHIYFEGMLADAEAKLLKAEVDPAIAKLTSGLAALKGELRGLAGQGDYEAGQVKFALQHLEAAEKQIQPCGATVTPEYLATLRRAQIDLEIAAEAFDAQPAPRALSRIAYDPQTKLYVVFGGEHMDYVSNDLWVFDPAKKHWRQRHPAAAPEPRSDHHFEPLGDGRIAMRGGCTHGSQPVYSHVGPARWWYDVAKNTWTPDGHEEKPQAADARVYWPAESHLLPEYYMKGPRPDAAAQAAKLAAVAVNNWTAMKPVHPLGGRDWGSAAFDPERSLFYVFNGGHVTHGGSDVARYHLATDRWEITEPFELPLGGLGTNEQFPSGVTFNLRPWMKKHTYNSYAFEPTLKKMILVGVNDASLDPYCYVYDPDKADWVARHRLPEGMSNGVGSIQVRYTKHGLLAWTSGAQIWLLDPKTMKWARRTVTGKMPGPSIDSCGMVYDSKRDRMLFITMGYGQPFDGQIHALDFAQSTVAPLNPEGMDDSKTWWFFPRDVAYHPASDMFLWGRLYLKNKNPHAPPLKDHFPAYDAAANRWVVLKLPVGAGVALPWVSGFMHYDAKRDLMWTGDTGGNGGVAVLHFDRAKTDVVPLKGFLPPTNEK